MELADTPERFSARGHLLVVADGMGAHAAGELASRMATDNIPHTYLKLKELPPGEAVVEAVREANRLINNKGQNSVDFQGMGTTCSCLVLLPTGALVAHVGDSRVYRVRGKVLEQLTFDHSLVWEIAAAGHASEEDVPQYVPKNVITRSLGPHPTVKIDLEGPFAVESGDKFLLCSDGLTGPLQPELIGMVLDALPPDEAAQTLVDLANLLGGPDNITVITAEVCDHTKMGTVEACPGAESEAMRPRREEASRTMVPIVALGLGLAVSGGLFLMGQMVAGAVVGLVTLVGAVLLMKPDGAPDTAPTCGAMLAGQAPYRTHNCEPSAEKVATLGDIVRQLEDLQGQADWSFDWGRILEDRNNAHEAMSRGHFGEAVVAFSSAVRRLMQSLRDHAGKTTGDSSLDLGNGG